MWFNAWRYRTALETSGNYPTYVAALDAAIDRTSRLDTLFAVGTHPLLIVVVAVATNGLTSRVRGSGTHFGH